ncbi:MAG: leucyl/phenylalanyl-tRNA--protein transferase [Alphaproteobacteria bacterium]|jgi:leucyl/phenylalanyl-tRNA--protein transferase|nr:leucyl/phenylalanyl-tRNA--protein transferase [Alphaproteobacteria bacterium]MCB1550645.1 leucyl/phenylalanyl-tRNA--protein transferase [Alphaproteobacteria bacterium]MCB9985957.1 leucyl/phenylalanyl-tRNA--protein transferase [Micavibrio sp.]HPQ51349.1 leucyl/phenylalanyl-tRNA--protein transferase [Alphaproteobacteria bacterium]
MVSIPDSLTPDDLLEIYAQGCFPMAESINDETFSIVEPRIRAVLPIGKLHIPKRLKRKIQQRPFEIRINHDFKGVISHCANARPDTWINHDIQTLFVELHERGVAHSVECWKKGQLVGGLYGLQLGGTFCGESMFSTETDASKVALVHLCARLFYAGFSVLDVQFHNSHLEQFGLYELPQADYCAILKEHYEDKPDFTCQGVSEALLMTRFLDRDLDEASDWCKQE